MQHFVLQGKVLSVHTKSVEGVNIELTDIAANAKKIHDFLVLLENISSILE